jgi:hypothetical protein
LFIDNIPLERSGLDLLLKARSIYFEEAAFNPRRVDFDRSAFYSWGNFLEIKLDEAFVIPMMPVILGKNFYQFSGQLFYFLGGPQISSRSAKISDAKSGAAQRTQLEDFNPK